MLSRWKRLTRAVGLARPARRASNPQVDRRCMEVFARVAHEARQSLSAAGTAFQLIRRSSSRPSRNGRMPLSRDSSLGSPVSSTIWSRRAALTLDRRPCAASTSICAGLSRRSRTRCGRKWSRSFSCWRCTCPRKRCGLTGIPCGFNRSYRICSSTALNTLIRAGTCRSSLAMYSGDAVLTVCDTGRGISLDALPHIFEPFTRGDDTSVEGLGVGLTIARQLVELSRRHDSRVQRRSWKRQRIRRHPSCPPIGIPRSGRPLAAGRRFRLRRRPSGRSRR